MIHDAVSRDRIDIVKYLAETEGVGVNGYSDESLFQHRCPAKFKKSSRYHSRDHNLLSCAARAGHVDLVKYLLDAGADLDYAIEFAAACGSRTLVRLLWEHGENGIDAVQAAFSMAVNREDTAMFILLKELGATLDEDVKMSLMKLAREDGRESMVSLLASA